MIKVLNIISDTNIGGAGRVLVNYLKCADRSRFALAVALPRGSALIPQLAPLGAELFEIDGMADKSFDPRVISGLKKLIREWQPDIVHTHGAMSGRIAGRQCGRTVIFTRHCAFGLSPRLQKGVGRLLYKTLNEHYADRIIAISPAAAKDLTDGGVSPEKIDVMMNGVEPVLRSEEARREFRARFGAGDGDFVLGILARIEVYKGHCDILRALKLLADEGLPLRLFIAGAGSYETELRRLCTELGLEDRVSFCGFQRDVAPFLSAIDLQLNASTVTETSSLSILEGYSMGLPAVVSDVGGNPCLMEPGQSGLMFPAGDAAALADCIRRICGDRALYQTLCSGAQALYASRFTGQIAAARTEEIYMKALEEKRK